MFIEKGRNVRLTPGEKRGEFMYEEQLCYNSPLCWQAEFLINFYCVIFVLNEKQNVSQEWVIRVFL